MPDPAEAYRRETPEPIDYGVFLNIAWHHGTAQIEELY